MGFPDGFLWGAATSSYQIEGAAGPDERGTCVWDEFCRRPGAVFHNHSGDVACDHVRRYREDVALMRDLGLKAYRFSISWPRVLPDGVGAVNDAGLAFYDRLVDELLDAGIAPCPTLFHWDLPTALQRRGGWLNRSIAGWFEDYARLVAGRLGDRVDTWMTLNEPQVYIDLGHRSGRHAPGLRLAPADQIVASHHTMLAHGRGAGAIREVCGAQARIGWAPVGVVSVPATDSDADRAAAMSAMEMIREPHVWNNTWFYDPVALGHYPDDGLALFGAMLPRGWEQDLPTINAKLDFLGANIYQGNRVRAGADGKPEDVLHEPGTARTSFEWPVVPESLYWGPKFLDERYGLPVMITENGLANNDWVHEDGRVHDQQRIDFTARYLRALARAIDEGVDVCAYFHWSLLDNFEWAEGYDKRFGLVHVDFATQKRTPKESAHWYAEVVRSNGSILGEAVVPGTA